MTTKHENFDQPAKFQAWAYLVAKNSFVIISNSYFIQRDYPITPKPQRNRPVNAEIRTDRSPGEHKSRTGFGFLVIIIAIISYTNSSC